MGLISPAKQLVPALVLHHNPVSKSKEGNEYSLLPLLLMTFTLMTLYKL